jgi:pentapeptide MXKDX repeat protein
MRKIIIATAALAFLSTSAFAQDKGAAPAAGGDSMSKSDMSKMSSKKTKKSKKSSMKSGDDSMSKQ